MTAAWPPSDLVQDLRTSPDGSTVTARTELYLAGKRHHVHSATLLIAADRVLSRLLRDGERLPDIDELRYRNLSNRNLILTASDSSSRIPRVASPAIRGSFRTDRGRRLFIEGAVSDDLVRRHQEPPGIFMELMGRMHLEECRGGTHRTRRDPLGPTWADCPDPVLARHAIVEFVLEGTRQPIRERFGNIDGYALVESLPIQEPTRELPALSGAAPGATSHRRAGLRRAVRARACLPRTS